MMHLGQVCEFVNLYLSPTPISGPGEVVQYAIVRGIGSILFFPSIPIDLSKVFGEICTMGYCTCSKNVKLSKRIPMNLTRR